MVRMLSTWLAGLALLWAVPVLAQNSDNPECLGVQCGTPRNRAAAVAAAAAVAVRCG